MDFHPTCTDLPVLVLYNIDRLWSPEDIAASHAAAEALCNSLRGEGHSVTQVCLEDRDICSRLNDFHPDTCLVFNWVEELPGVSRSWSHAAQQLEKRGFTYTGSDSLVLALSQDKRLVKSRLQERGIPTPSWQEYTSITSLQWTPFPAIVKPAFEHCSYGIARDSVVQNQDELTQRVRYVLEEWQQPALVEDFIDGREFYVGVIGNGALHVLPPAELDYSCFSDIHDRLCTYEAKFDTSSLANQQLAISLPASLTNEQHRHLEEVAIAAYRAIGCRDYARIDVRLRDGIFYVLDVNPNADITPETSLVRAAEMVGYTYGQFGSLLVHLALKRHPGGK